jgi:hypothetical protein
MLVQIPKNATKEQIQEALARFEALPKHRKGYPKLEDFFGTIDQRDYLQLQKQMRDEW